MLLFSLSFYQYTSLTALTFQHVPPRCTTNIDRCLRIPGVFIFRRFEFQLIGSTVIYISKYVFIKMDEGIMRAPMRCCLIRSPTSVIPTTEFHQGIHFSGFHMQHSDQKSNRRLPGNVMELGATVH